jgi:hypothetical protein
LQVVSCRLSGGDGLEGGEGFGFGVRLGVGLGLRRFRLGGVGVFGDRGEGFVVLVAGDGVDQGGGRRRGGLVAREGAGGDFETLDEGAGPLDFEGVVGEEEEDLAEGEADGSVVLDGREGELGERGLIGEVGWRGIAVGAVEETELVAAHGGRAAALARHVDVTTEEAAFGILHCFGHFLFS